MDAKRRRWFQIHLSTAVVLMVAAGLMLLANCRPHEFIDKWEESMTDNPGEGLHYNLYGWPVVGAFHGGLIPRNAMDIELYGNLVGYWEIRTGALLINLCVGLSILAAVTVISEFLIRRREIREGRITKTHVGCSVFAWWFRQRARRSRSPFSAAPPGLGRRGDAGFPGLTSWATFWRRSAAKTA